MTVKANYISGELSSIVLPAEGLGTVTATLKDGRVHYSGLTGDSSVAAIEKGLYTPATQAFISDLRERLGRRLDWTDWSRAQDSAQTLVGELLLGRAEFERRNPWARELRLREERRYAELDQEPIEELVDPKVLAGALDELQNWEEEYQPEDRPFCRMNEDGGVWTF